MLPRASSVSVAFRASGRRPAASAAATTSSASGLSRSLAQRDPMVAPRSRPMADQDQHARAGGSSSVFRSAFAALRFIDLGAVDHRDPPAAGGGGHLQRGGRRAHRVDGDLRAEAPVRGSRSGRSRRDPGWTPWATWRNTGWSGAQRQLRIDGVRASRSARAKRKASVALPMPGGPVSSQPCASLPEASAGQARRARRPDRKARGCPEAPARGAHGRRRAAQVHAEAAHDQLAHVGGDGVRRARRIDHDAALGLGAGQREKAFAHPLVERARHPLVALCGGRPLVPGKARGHRHVQITVRSGRRSPSTLRAGDRSPPRRPRRPRPGTPRRIHEAIA